MYEKIVVPLDGSQLAEVALPYAGELAAKMDSNIVLLSVLESAEPDEHQENQIYLKKKVETTKQLAERYLKRSDHKPVKVGAATRIGYPAEGILSYTNKGGFVLIIMATHGRSGIGRWALGSVADKVVRTTTRQPMMLIRARGARPDMRKKGVLRKMLIPLDGSIMSEVTIPYVSEIASRLEGELTLLRVVSQANHIYEEAEDYLKKVSRMLEDRGIITGYQVKVGVAADVIIDLADELNVDLVAMSTRGRTGVNLWVLGSVAQKVLLGGNTPLLLVRA